MSEAFGSVWREFLPGKSFVCIADPEEYAKVVQVDGRLPIRMQLGPMAYHRVQKGWGLGLVNSNGEEWLQLRQAVAPVLMRQSEVQQHAPAMDQIAVDFVTKMKSELDVRSMAISNLDRKFFLWSMESISVVLIDKRFGCFNSTPPQEARDFIENLIGFFDKMQLLLYDFPIYEYFNTKKYQAFCHHADNMLNTMQRYVDNYCREIQGRGKGESRSLEDPFVVKLLNRGLDNKLAVETVVDLFTGSVETTANTLGWVLYNIAVNPKVQEKAFEEVKQVLEECGGKIDKLALGRLSYIKAVIRETFRLFPITATTSRIISEPVQLGGFLVPEGTHCQASLYPMGRNPMLFQDPLEFKPERWLRGEEEMDQKTKAFASLPFGHGARMCIGRRLAEQELYIIVARILETFQVSYPEFSPPPDPILKLVMMPKNPIPLRFKIRNKKKYSV